MAIGVSKQAKTRWKRGCRNPAIARDFTVCHDAIINVIMNGPVGMVNELESRNPELAVAIDDLENGRFSNPSQSRRI